ASRIDAARAGAVRLGAKHRAAAVAGQHQPTRWVGLRTRIGDVPPGGAGRNRVQALVQELVLLQRAQMLAGQLLTFLVGGGQPRARRTMKRRSAPIRLPKRAARSSMPYWPGRTMRDASISNGLSRSPSSMRWPLPVSVASIGCGPSQLTLIGAVTMAPSAGAT